nr:uncharacterized protein LOC107439825 [Parasteatoda tepidariorum]
MGNMKNLMVSMMIYLILLDLLCLQTTEALRDLKNKAYAVGAVKKGVSGTAAGVVGKPLKLVGVILGPLGLPFKIKGGKLKAKSAVHWTKSGVKTVKKWSKISAQYG